MSLFKKIKWPMLCIFLTNILVLTPVKASQIQALVEAINSQDQVAVSKLIENVKQLNTRTASASVAARTTPLIVAAEVGNLKIVELLLSSGADVNFTRADGYTPTMSAANAGKGEVLKLFLAHGADVNVEDPNGFAAYDYALRNNHIEVMLALLAFWQNEMTEKDKSWMKLAFGKQSKTDLIKKPSNEVQSFVLVTAILRNDIEILHTLLKAGIDPNKHNRSGYAALPMAVRLNHIEMIKLLLANGAFPTIGNDGNDEAIPMNQAARGGRLVAAKLLIAEGASVNKPNARGYTPLMLASLGELPMLSLILEHDADTELKNIHGNTALLFAVSANKMEQVQLLLKHGANINATNHNGNSALVYAVKHPKMFNYLLTQGANIQAKSKAEHNIMDYVLESNQYEEVTLTLLESHFNQSLSSIAKQDLFSSVVKGDIKMIKERMAQGDLFEQPTAFGYSLLNYAAHFGHKDIVKLLLDNGAQPNTRGEDGYRITPLMHAAINNHAEIGELLINNGANVLAVDRYGDAVINWATTYGNKEFVIMMLKHGADPTVVSDAGWTAIKTAKEQGRTELLELLTKHAAKHNS